MCRSQPRNPVRYFHRHKSAFVSQARAMPRFFFFGPQPMAAFLEPLRAKIGRLSLASPALNLLRTKMPRRRERQHLRPTRELPYPDISRGIPQSSLPDLHPSARRLSIDVRTALVIYFVHPPARTIPYLFATNNEKELHS